MKRIIAIMAAVMLLSACGNQNGNQQTQKEKPIPQREGITFGELLPGESDDELGYVEDATMTYTSTDGFTDTLYITLLFPMDYETIDLTGVGKIEEEDINFDGIKDLQVHVGNFNAAGNAMYEGFVWDKEKGVFVRVPEYFNISDPEINEEEKSISGALREWVDGTEYVSFEKYQWVNGELTKVDEWEDTFTLDDDE